MIISGLVVIWTKFVKVLHDRFIFLEVRSKL